MKKIKIAVMALVASIVMIGCGEVDGSIFGDGFMPPSCQTVAGLSAYEVAVDNGFSGTEAEWLESLRGDAGVQGISGLDGLSAYQLWILAGNEGNETDFINSLQGIDGVDGVDGVCPDCNATLIPEPPIVTEKPCPPKLDDNDTRIHFIYYHNRLDLTAYSLQYFTNTSSIPQLMNIVGIEVGEEVEGLSISEVNGTTIIKGFVPLFENADEHGVGLTFEKKEVLEPEPVIAD